MDLSFEDPTDELGGSAPNPTIIGRGAPFCPEGKPLKASRLSHWQVLTPRLLGPTPSVGRKKPQTSEQPNMTIEHPMFPPREIEIYEPFATQDAFCEALGRIERIGSNRRLVFVVTDTSPPARWL
jgi:hypothetical protein